MRPRIVLGLTSLLLWLPGVINTDAKHRPWWLTTLLFVLLTIYLFRGRTRAFRIYRGLLWFFLIISIIVMLLYMGGINAEYRIIRSSSNLESILFSLFWIVVISAVLYYSDKDHVRADYDLAPKKGSVNG